jgi:multiple sugar transport system permease protein
LPETVTNYLRLFNIIRPSGAYGGNVPPGVRYIGRSFFNSLIVSSSSTLIAILLASFSAYAFSKLRFKGTDRILTLTIGLRMLPVTSVIIPIFIMMNFLHLLDNIGALVIMYIAMLLPYDILMLTSFFESIPSDLDDSARVDGCNRLQSLFLIIMPLASPGLVAVAIFNFLVSWNEFYVALILTRSVNSYTMPVIISMFTTVPQMMPYDYMITAGIVGSLPPLILSLIFSKYIIRGLIAGAIK